MNQNRSALFIGLLALALGACKNSPSSPGPTPAVDNHVFPLAVGNSWTLGISSPDTSIHAATATMTVLKDTLIDGETWYATTIVQVLGPVQVFLTNRTAGTYLYAAGPSAGPSLWFKYPAIPGDKYTHGGDLFSVASTTDTVVVPAGTFVCYHYVEPFHDYWFVPHTGLVRSIEYVYSADLSHRDILGTIELLSYHLN